MITKYNALQTRLIITRTWWKKQRDG